jgi:SAM-dependent methyltransferase
VLLEAFDPPRVVLLAGAALAVAALPLSRKEPPKLIAGAVLGAGLLLSGSVLKWLPDPVVDRNKGYEEFRNNGLIKASQWDPVFRVDVGESPLARGDLFLLFHDGLPGSGMRRFPSHAFDHLDNSSRRLPFEVLSKPSPRVLIVGSAGGHEVVAALHFGAVHVTAVELNSATLGMLNQRFGDVTGHLDKDPRVKFVNGDARWFLEQTKDKYDLIWMVAPDSYAAMNASTSGAFVLAESYLYTVEMIEQIFRRLSPGGILCAQFGEVDYERKPNRTLRFLATARQFYFYEKIPDIDERTLVATSEGFAPYLESTILISRSAFTPEQIGKFVFHTERRAPLGVVRYFPHGPLEEVPVTQMIATPQDMIAEWLREQSYQIGPVFDDSPFFWHFTGFWDSVGGTSASPGKPVDYEDGVGERVILVLFGVAIVLGASCLFLPFAGIRETWKAIPHKTNVAVYFGALGIGFMFVEVPLIQRLTLLLGYPTRSLSVTLFGLLLSTGLGSLLSTRYRRAPLRSLGVLIATLFVLLALWHLISPRAVQAALGLPLPVRIAVALLLIAPIGLCLGGFLPLGLAVAAGASPHPRPFIAWAWAVNAFASVVGSILAAIVAMAAGFKFLLVAAPVIYVAGALFLMRVSPAPAETADGS